ncbi:MAG: hypothetical protein HYY13_00400, partial [Nitrospirae bacterium]|nr:hypothetical protein [Nitrospirota bacterium]
TVGTPAYFEKVRTACRIAEKRGMKINVYFGTSWETGSPHPGDGKERQLLLASQRLTGPARFDGPLPTAQPPEYLKLVQSFGGGLAQWAFRPFDERMTLVAATAARVTNAETEPLEIEAMEDLTAHVSGGRLSWQVPEGEWLLFALYENRTGQLVLSSAAPGSPQDTLVIDHLNRRGIQEMFEWYGEPLEQSLAPYFGGCLEAVVIDSPELNAELPWTSDFLDQFTSRAGYDLRPYLPLLFFKFGETDLIAFMPEVARYSAEGVGHRVREDYVEVRSRLFLEAFVHPLAEWARERGILFRNQAHGGYADLLDSYAASDIPESETLWGARYDFFKLVSSAAHVAGRRRVASETFTTRHMDPRGLRIEDFYLLAGRSVVAGINQIFHVGYPYGGVRENGKSWFEDYYAMLPGTGITSWSDEKHPEWERFPDLHAYIARLSYAMTVGRDVSDLAWLRVRRDADNLAAMSLQANLTIAEPMGLKPFEGDSVAVTSLREAGLTFDWISRSMLESGVAAGGRLRVGEAEYGGLLITDLEAATPALMRAIERATDAGVPVFVVGGLPHESAGYRDANVRDAEVRALLEALAGRVAAVESPGAVGASVLAAGLVPAVAVDAPPIVVRLARRSVRNGTLLVLFNEGPSDRTDTVRLSLPGRSALIFDPQSGRAIGSDDGRDAQGRLIVRVSVPARRAAVLFVQNP